MKRKFKIWHVIEGPLTRRYVIDHHYEGYEEGLDELPTKANYLVLAMVEEGGKLREEEFWFPEEWQAYKFKHAINSNMEALEVDGSEYTCENGIDI
tara:strand:+ start:343 stop:630 length:288 start_codon:yes stop_codon:yes gene_type:complete